MEPFSYPTLSFLNPFPHMSPQFNIAIMIVFMLFSLELIVMVNRHTWLSNCGLIPRSNFSIKRILISQVIHVNFTHFFTNMTTFIVLIILMPTTDFFMHLLLLSWAGVGSLVWLAGRKATHIGFSGIIFSLAGFCLGSFLREPILSNALAAGVSFFVFLPKFLITNKEVWRQTSIEGHFFGYLFGMTYLLLYTN